MSLRDVVLAIALCLFSCGIICLGVELGIVEFNFIDSGHDCLGFEHFH